MEDQRGKKPPKFEFCAGLIAKNSPEKDFAQNLLTFVLSHLGTEERFSCSGKYKTSSDEYQQPLILSKRMRGGMKVGVLGEDACLKALKVLASHMNKKVQAWIVCILIDWVHGRIWIAKPVKEGLNEVFTLVIKHLGIKNNMVFSKWHVLSKKAVGPLKKLLNWDQRTTPRPARRPQVSTAKETDSPSPQNLQSAENPKARDAPQSSGASNKSETDTPRTRPRDSAASAAVKSKPAATLKRPRKRQKSSQERPQKQQKVTKPLIRTPRDLGFKTFQIYTSSQGLTANGDLMAPGLGEDRDFQDMGRPHFNQLMNSLHQDEMFGQGIRNEPVTMEMAMTFDGDHMFEDSFSRRWQYTSK